MRVVVGRVARPHGVRGEVAVEPRTDQPATRFAPGRVLLDDGGARLRVLSSRAHAGRWLLRFEQIRDRDAAEGLRGRLLEAEVEAPAEPEVYADATLVGMRARLADATLVGTVTGVEHLPMQDLLVIRTATGSQVRVPFVAALVPHVDVDAATLTLEPPPGLLDAGSET